MWDLQCRDNAMMVCATAWATPCRRGLRGHSNYGPPRNANPFSTTTLQLPYSLTSLLHISKLKEAQESEKVVAMTSGIYSLAQDELLVA